MSSRKDIKLSELFNAIWEKRAILSYSIDDEISKVYANSKNKAQTCKELTEIVKTSKTESEILEALKKL